MRLGDIARVGVTLIFGTDVYTKSTPHRNAAIEDKIGAP